MKNLQFALLDFDGLLVDTESAHHKAYVLACAKSDYTLNWDFPKYCHYAHSRDHGVRQGLLEEGLHLTDEEWARLYEEKQRRYQELLQSGSIRLMPGVKAFLLGLKEAKIPSCVVTNSRREQIMAIRKQLSALDAIPHWITREDYQAPKPSPEGYLTAIERYAEGGREGIVGFEDTPRGIEALEAAGVTPFLICSKEMPYLETMQKRGVSHYITLGEWSFAHTPQRPEKAPVQEPTSAPCGDL